VDYLVVQFPAGTRDFPHEVARELASLVEAEMVRVLDEVIVERDVDGRLRVLEPGELGPRGVLRQVESDLRVVLSDRDLEELGELLGPGCAAGLVVWEQLWSEPLVDSARRSGGRFLGVGPVGGPSVDADPTGTAQ
jgi:hypothetical protein